MFRSLLTWPKDISHLKQLSKEVKLNDPETKSCISDVVDTFNILQGYGLAAPQIGIFKRIMVINPAALGFENTVDRLVMINPTLELGGGTFQSHESCFSVPDISAVVNRHEECTVTFTTLEGEEKTVRTSGLPAACIQHEVDHLDGVLFVDRLSKLKRGIIIRKIKKMQQKRQRVEREAALDFERDHDELMGLSSDGTKKKTTHSHKRKPKRRMSRKSKSNRKRKN